MKARPVIKKIKRKYGYGQSWTDWGDLARTAGYVNEHQMFKEMYADRQLSMSKIGQRVGFSKQVVLYHLRKHGILRRPWGGVNHFPTQQWRLWHFDQRLVIHGPLREVAQAAQVSFPELWKYRRWIETSKEWAEVYATKEQVDERRRQNQRIYRIYQARYGRLSGLSKIVHKRQRIDCSWARGLRIQDPRLVHGIGRKASEFR